MPRNAAPTPAPTARIRESDEKQDRVDEEQAVAHVGPEIAGERAVEDQLEQRPVARGDPPEPGPAGIGLHQFVPAEHRVAALGRPVGAGRRNLPGHHPAVLGDLRRGGGSGRAPQRREFPQPALQPAIEALDRDRFEAADMDDTPTPDGAQRRAAIPRQSQPSSFPATAQPYAMSGTPRKWGSTFRERLPPVPAAGARCEGWGGRIRPFALRKSPATASISRLSTSTSAFRRCIVASSSFADRALSGSAIAGFASSVSVRTTGASA